MLRSFVAGQVLLREGDPADAVYVIRSGAVRVYKRDLTTHDKTIELARLGPGDVIGELGPILRKLRTATVQAVGPTQVLEIPAHRLRALMKQQAPLVRVVAQALRERAGLSETEIADLAAGAGVALPTEQNGAGRLPAPAHDSTIVYPKRVDCPACGIGFSALVVHARKDQPTERASDFHNAYTTAHNPYDYELWVCPNDLYAAFPSDFADLREHERSHVARIVEQVVAGWGDDVPEFNVDRTFTLRQRSLELALALYRMRELSPARLAAVMHRLAWCARERGDTVLEQTWLRQALDSYTCAFQEVGHGDTKEELRLQYLCGELTMRLGDPDGAIKWFSEALRTPSLKEHASWERMLRDQWAAARSAKSESVV